MCSPDIKQEQTLPLEQGSDFPPPSPFEQRRDSGSCVPACAAYRDA